MQLRDRKGNTASVKFRSIRIEKYADTSGDCETSWTLQYGLDADILLTDRKGKKLVKSKIEFDCSKSHFYIDKNCAFGFEDKKIDQEYIRKSAHQFFVID